MNLSELKSEQIGYVLDINLPLRERQRLASMGIIKGSEIFILRNNKQSSLVIEYKDTFLAISHDIAKNISVTDKLPNIMGVL